MVTTGMIARISMMTTTLILTMTPGMNLVSILMMNYRNSLRSGDNYTIAGISTERY